MRTLSPSNEVSVNHPTSSSAAKSKLTPKKHARAKENAPPLDPNSLASDRSASPASAVKMRCALPPRPPSSNPLKRKLSAEVNTENGVAGGADSGVKVIVRMRPQIQDEGYGEMTVQKLSDDSLSISGHTFTFDAVADTQASQVDIFELVGAPLVENCLAGFNSSVFAYGQTGSGKTYTMWGPSHALGEVSSLSDQQGLTPRILECLFNRINEEQSKQTDKQLTYQCRCSFLEIYNEQITDLLDPNQKNVQIREDVKSGIYVENLTEESVSTMKDVQQLLRKGLANRRTGATSINAESSRSHSVFTCIIESRCKSTDGLSSFKSSRINLVDLAGSERQKLTGAAGERLKEAGNINRSLSQLGNLINILAEVSQSGKQRHIPYRDSKLTFLLQESLGGNARLAMICAISPIQSCKSETFSTLRFAQRAKAIKNKAVVNEVMEDDVKVLREVIRQLKDELVRIKATGYNPGDPSGGCRLSGQDVRRSLNLLKLSLRHPMMLPRIDDGDEEMEVEMEVDEEAIENLCAQVGLQFSSSKDIRKSKVRKSAVVKQEMPALSKVVEDSDVKMEEEIISEQSDIQINHEPSLSASVPEEPSSADKVPGNSSNSSEQCPDVDPSTLKSPTLSVSPKIVSTSRKSLRTSSMLTASQNDIKFDIDMEPEAVPIPSPKPTRKSSSLLPTQTSRNYLVPTERLAASLNRGLEILNGHRKSTTLRGSAFRFSYKHAELKSMIPVMKVDVGVQTSKQDIEMKSESNEGSNMQMVVHDGAQCSEKPKQVPKAVEKVLAGSFRREMALEEYCANQAAEIKQLNRLVQQYKHERECNAMIAQTKEDKILRLESLMDGVLPPEEFLEEEFASLKHEHKLLKEKYENNPEVQEAKIESKRLQDELEQYRNFFQLGEKEVLVEEVQDLRFQLQYYIDSSSRRKEEQLLQLRYSREPTSAPPPLSIIPETEENSEKSEETEEDKFEEERKQWTEAESKWISLAEELRSELDSARSLAEKLKQDLTTEQKCTEELNEAMVSAMQGHARMLENYADLEEKHMQLLARHRRMQQGIEDVKKAAVRAGVRGAESKFINSLAAEVSALRMQMEKERQHFRSENRELKAQLEDTAEAVQAAGELLVRLKEAEESVVAAENRAALAAQETERAYKEIESMRRELQLQQQQMETNTLKKVHPDTSPFHKEDSPPRFDSTEPHNLEDEDLSWRDEFKGLYTNEEQGEVSKLEEPYSWFSGYDRCNI